MRKKWLALALSLTMVAGCLTGCGGSDKKYSPEEISAMILQKLKRLLMAVEKY